MARTIGVYGSTAPRYLDTPAVHLPESKALYLATGHPVAPEAPGLPDAVGDRQQATNRDAPAGTPAKQEGTP